MPATDAAPVMPRLSAIVVVGERRDRIGRCLAGLLAQGNLAELEIVLVDLEPEAAPPAGAQHPSVRRLPLAPDTTFAEARRRGLLAARAPIVAFLEEHAAPLAGWSAALLRATRGRGPPSDRGWSVPTPAASSRGSPS